MFHSNGLVVSQVAKIRMLDLVYLYCECQHFIESSPNADGSKNKCKKPSVAIQTVGYFGDNILI